MMLYSTRVYLSHHYADCRGIPNITPSPLPSSAGARHTGVRIQQCKVFAGFAQVVPTYRHFKHDFHNWKCTRGRIIMRIIVMEDFPVISSSQRSIECLPRKRAGAMYQRRVSGTYLVLSAALVLLVIS